MIKKELLEFFLTEAEEHISLLEKGFLQLDSSDFDNTLIHELFRTAHTLKGAAALVKMSTLSGIAHKMEDILETVRDGQLAVSKEIVDWLLHSLDSIKLLVSDASGDIPEREGLLDEIISTIPHEVTEKVRDHLENKTEDIEESTFCEEVADIEEEPAHKEMLPACTDEENPAYAETFPACTDEENPAHAETFPAFTDEENPAHAETFPACTDEENPAHAETFPACTNAEVEGESSNEEVLPEQEVAVPIEQPQEELSTVAKHRDNIDPVSTFVRVHVDNLDKMMGLVGELTILKNFFISETEGVNDLKNELEYACKRLIREIDDFDSRYAHSAPEKISYIDSLLEDFRELEFDRYDGINLFANSIKEIMSDVNVAVKSISSFFTHFSGHMTSLDKLNMEFRDIISTSRMVETGSLFHRFTRVVRDLTDNSGKKVSLIMRGGHTRIDRIVYERLFTPLLHLVRNAFSHGIESPEERRASAKREEGSIILSAKRDGNSVVIEVQDDGIGINLQKVYSTAANKGIIKNGENIPESQLYNILFMPGFSTLDTVDMTSGRGVGLDAVKQAVSEINGTINIESAEGKGTTFRITLPLTLIVVNMVKFRAGGLDFAVPSSLVHELMNIDAAKYDRDMGSIRLRDEEVPLKNLCNLFNLSQVQSHSRIPILIFDLFGRKTALIVDEITGQEDTVIKPLGGFLEGLNYCSGFSISADARLAPVINPVGLLETSVELTDAEHDHMENRLNNNILVVDDSLSVRKFAGMILEQYGYNVLTAANGLEALKVIDENNIDLIFTDLEMPVMHGYELLRELKRRGLSDTIPAVVLTSRSNEKHKEKAKSLGAREYIVKPFDELSLIQAIRKNMKRGMVIPAD